MNLFYIEDSGNPDQMDDFILKGQEAIHAAKVLRIREGDPILATDGNGTVFRGEVKSASQKLLRAVIQEKFNHPRQEPEITVAIGNIKKRDRLEFAVEKAVELGVGKIIIFHAGNSEKKRVRLDRLRSTALVAMKQSLRAWYPDVIELQNLETVLETRNDYDETFIADEQLGPETESAMWDMEAKKLLYIVGPEGGFTGFERELFNQYGCKSFSLGPYRLRTETAVVAIATLSGSRSF
jgi:16S rRNA (uracil1498-N3)-methyltransferase